MVSEELPNTPPDSSVLKHGLGKISECCSVQLSFKVNKSRRTIQFIQCGAAQANDLDGVRVASSLERIVRQSIVKHFTAIGLKSP